MSIKIYKKIIILVLISIINISCSTVKEAFDPERKNSSEEFLVKKKSPLSMPPNFDKLPTPKTFEVNSNNKNEKDLQSLILTNENNEIESKINNQDISKDQILENLILDRIKSN